MSGSVEKRPNDSHPFYTIDGDEYVRVTHPLGYWIPPQLKNWFIKQTAESIQERKDTTAKQGSDIHKKAETGKEDRLTALLKSLEMEIMAQEFVVFSKNGWAGSVDLLVHHKGKNILIDIKTGRFGQAWPQLGAYSLAANEMGMDVEGIGVISLPRDETKEAGWFDYSEHYEGGQIAYCQIFDFWKRSEHKKLKLWKFFPGLATFSYNWSPEGLKGLA